MLSSTAPGPSRPHPSQDGAGKPCGPVSRVEAGGARGARPRGLPVTARLHLPGHARVTPDALEVPCSNFNFIVSQSFSGSS